MPSALAPSSSGVPLLSGIWGPPHFRELISLQLCLRRHHSRLPVLPASPLLASAFCFLSSPLSAQL